MKAFIFDFNGTMVFDSVMHETAWRHYVEKLIGRSVSEEEFRKSVHGKTSYMILKHFLGGKEMSQSEMFRVSEEKEEMYRKLCEEKGDAFTLAKGLPEFLGRAKSEGISLNIATAANLANIDYYFEKFSLDEWFDYDLVVYDNGKIKGKPEPDIYLAAMEKIGAKPSETTVFEDAISGGQAARAAGVSSVVGIYGDSNVDIMKESGLFSNLYADFDEAFEIFA